MRLVVWSDTHWRHRLVELPPGDILVHAGDFSRTGSLTDVQGFNAFLGELPHPHKIVVAGNHDWAFQNQPAAARRALSNAIYLQDEALRLEGFNFYGSPWQPEFFNWAFNLPRGPALREKWQQIPAHTDVLITHGPPLGVLDQVRPGRRAGCEELRTAVARVRPRYHLFGHIHESAGVFQDGPTTFVNAAMDLALRGGDARAWSFDLE